MNLRRIASGPTRSLFGRAALLGVAAAVLSLAVACGDSDDEDSAEGDATQAPRLSGAVGIDGSSTVFPITEAVAEEFRKDQPGVNVTVGIAGRGGGFQRFCRGETDISNASRPISSSEQQACAAANIQYVELPVAYDALSVVVNSQNNWATCITVPELKKMWEPAAQGAVASWADVNPAWSAGGSLKLFGPGTDSGTFDYFTEHVNGRAKDSRSDFTASEDDNVLVQGVAGDRSALGYFGLAYYEENRSRLKALQVSQTAGGQCVEPNAANVENGSYPLSRPLFVYVKKDAILKPEVKAFVDFYMENAAKLAEDVGYVKFPDNYYTLVKGRWTAQKVGTMYANAPQGSTLLSLLQAP
jgi:phosphate transport system substrate-binding protein